MACLLLVRSLGPEIKSKRIQHGTMRKNRSLFTNYMHSYHTHWEPPHLRARRIRLNDSQQVRRTDTGSEGGMKDARPSRTFVDPGPRDHDRRIAKVARSVGRGSERPIRNGKVDGSIESSENTDSRSQWIVPRILGEEEPVIILEKVKDRLIKDPHHRLGTKTYRAM